MFLYCLSYILHRFLTTDLYFHHSHRCQGRISYYDHEKMGWLLLVTALLSVIVLMALFPEAALQSALRGLSIWWDVLFPSLFPFFVISEVAGVRRSPPDWHAPGPYDETVISYSGAGGFVAMGYVSGYPVGAKLTAKLWEQKW